MSFALKNVTTDHFLRRIVIIARPHSGRSNPDEASAKHLKYTMHTHCLTGLLCYARNDKIIT